MADRLPSAMTAMGFSRKAITDLENNINKQETYPLHVDSWLAAGWSKPFRHLWLGEAGGTIASMVIPTGSFTVDNLAKTAGKVPGVVLVDNAGEISNLFGEYRRRGTFSLVFAYALIFAVLLPKYGPRGAALAVIPVGVAGIVVLATVALAGFPVNLFTLFGMVLLLGIGMDYSIFLAEAGEHREAAFLALSLACFTTMLSFGLLMLSSTPALQSIGLVVLVGTPTALVLSPVATSKIRGRLV
jgi:predicted exporter